MQRASVDLPLPLSPTMPRISPRSSASETPSSAGRARTAARPPPHAACPYDLVTPSTASRGSAMDGLRQLLHVDAARCAMLVDADQGDRLAAALLRGQPAARGERATGRPGGRVR